MLDEMGALLSQDNGGTLKEQGCSAEKLGHFDTIAENEAESADVRDLRTSRLISLMGSPRDSRFMNAAIKATKGEFFESCAGGDDTAAARPAAPKTLPSVLSYTADHEMTFGLKMLRFV